jgi:DNA-binding transcriptional MerR regulator
MGTRGYTVSQVAKLAHVTVRTLHHYDELGLMRPSERSQAGYRQYSVGDLGRLQQILLYRELGFTLEAIGELIDEPVLDRGAALRAQRALLVERVNKTKTVITAVDRALRALERGQTMAPEKMFEGFEEFDHAAHADEARERWGETASYKESMQRTKRYGKDDWTKIKAEAEEIAATLAALKAAGRKPNDRDVVDAAERHRLHIDRWFYPCDHARHSALGAMYVADPRFTAYYEKRGAGLAAFVAEAIAANAARRS